MALINTSGKITLLRVHDVGTGFGPANDKIDVEVVFQLNTNPDRFIGFQLRNDANQIAHQGMLDLLRDGLNFGWVVNTDYEIRAGKHNGVALRIWLTKPVGLTTGGIGGDVLTPRSR
jgi:hypothetical protein